MIFYICVVQSKAHKVLLNLIKMFDSLFIHYISVAIEQEPLKSSQNRPPPMSSPCLLSVEKLKSKSKFNQRREKMEKERKIVKQSKIILL